MEAKRLDWNKIISKKNLPAIVIMILALLVESHVWASNLLGFITPIVTVSLILAFMGRDENDIGLRSAKIMPWLTDKYSRFTSATMIMISCVLVAAAGHWFWAMEWLWIASVVAAPEFIASPVSPTDHVNKDQP